MKTVTTASGFQADIEESRLDDMELLDALVAIQKGNTSLLPEVVDKIMGGQKIALYEHLRNSSGITPITAVMKAVFEIIDLIGGKNS